jgi:hypothetical protein
MIRARYVWARPWVERALVSAPKEDQQFTGFAPIDVKAEAA